jgi:hypothetical protein
MIKLNKKLSVVAFLGGIATAAMAVVTSLTFSGRLDPDASDWWKADLQKGTHMISAEAWGSGDLDLYVYDADGKMIAYDEDDDNIPVVFVNMPKVGRIYVEAYNSHTKYPVSYNGSID